MSGGASEPGTDLATPADTSSSTAATSLGSAATMAADESASASQSSSVLKAGTVLGDRYRILARIGAGGMGTVYRAIHIAIGKPVAIKVLAGDWANRPELALRFTQEARSASLVRHPNIVDITDFGYVGEGLPYFVMEYLEGETLGQRIARVGRLPWAQAQPLIVQVLAALHAAHEHGVIHRDMKPDNCFIVTGEQPERVKVLDFGIAKVIAEGTSQQLTQTGAVMGTAAYMSPEQAQSLELDARTDVYSAAVVLFEMLTGRLPFIANGFLGVLTKHLTERAPPLRKVAPDAAIPVQVERAVLKAMAKDRAERHASAAELAAVLGAIGLGATRRRAWLVPAAIAGVVALSIVAWRASERRQRRAERNADRVMAGADEPTSIATLPLVPSSPVQPPALEPSAAPTATIAAPALPTVTDDARPTDDPPPPEPTGSHRRGRGRRHGGDTPTPLPESLSPKAIDRALAPARKQALRCGSEHAALPGMRVRVTFSIGADGKVTDAVALKPNAMLAVGRCVADAVRRVRFPAALGPTTAITRELVTAE